MATRQVKRTNQATRANTTDKAKQAIAPIDELQIQDSTGSDKELLSRESHPIQAVKILLAPHEEIHSSSNLNQPIYAKIKNTAKEEDKIQNQTVNTSGFMNEILYKDIINVLIYLKNKILIMKR
jgi:hypothetical protein